MNGEFERFIKNFDLNEFNINRKYTHSLRVQKINEELAQNQNLSKHDIKLAKLIGLLHDYGRFYQWSKYKTFNDEKSIDHADYAAEELIDKRKITKFYNKEEDYRVIYEAIKYHNKYSIPDDAENKLMCEMIRDADKLDLLYMYAINDFKIEEGEISKEVEDQFYHHELIAFKNKKTMTDNFINGLSFIFDLNLKCSFKYLKKEKLVEKIYENIKDKNKFKKYFEEIDKFIESKLREED